MTLTILQHLINLYIFTPLLPYVPVILTYIPKPVYGSTSANSMQKVVMQCSLS